jgi:hypothetical protein
MLSHRSLSLRSTLHPAGDDGGAPAAISESVNPSIESSGRTQTLHFGEGDSESDDGTLDFLRPSKKQCGAPTRGNGPDNAILLGATDPAPKAGLRPSQGSVAPARLPRAIVDLNMPALSGAGVAQPLMKNAPSTSASDDPASHASVNRASHPSKYFPPARVPAQEKNQGYSASTTERSECATPPKDSSDSGTQLTSQGVSTGADSDMGASFIFEQGESHLLQANLPSKRCNTGVHDVSLGSSAPAAATTGGGAAVLTAPPQRPRSDGLPPPTSALSSALSSGTALTGIDSRLREPRVIEARPSMRAESPPILSKPTDLFLAPAPASPITLLAPSLSPPVPGSLLPRATNPLLLASRRAMPVKPPASGMAAPAATARFSASLIQGCADVWQRTDPRP